MTQETDSNRSAQSVRPKAQSSVGREVTVTRAYPTGFDRSVEDSQVRILVPDPGQNWWYGRWFPPSDDALNRSRAALQRYRNRFREFEDKYNDEFPFPWRSIPNPATGLSAYVRGWLVERVDHAKDAVNTAQLWLEGQQNALSVALKPILVGDAAWEARLYQTPDLTVSHPPSIDISDAKAELFRARFHVRYQQWYRAQWPVFGGQINVHMVESDPRVSVTSTYFPVFPDKPFSVVITEAHALKIALQGVVHYQPAATSDMVAYLKETWHIRLRLYTESEQKLFILPFAGDYRLAYEILLTAPDYSQAWSVFVDAETGDVLGRPSSLIFFDKAHAWANSQEASSLGSPAGTLGAAAPQPSLEQDLAENPCQEFMEIAVFDLAGNLSFDQQGQLVQNLHGNFKLPDWMGGDKQGVNFEATNIAIHAKLMYDHLLALYSPNQRQMLSAKLATRRLAAQVATLYNGGTFVMGFVYQDWLIQFQNDEGGGFIIDQHPVHYPSQDPEVIYHEVHHGIMALLNSDPFEHLIGTAPFARSLVEGYANYAARSFAVTIGAARDRQWASAAYRAGDWQQRWALSRNFHAQGEDLLVPSNLYPSAISDDPEIYNVGMIWARALWDLRELVGASVADWLAFEAFSAYAHGWVTSFEVVAEGLIDAAQKLTTSTNLAVNTIEWGNALLPLFSGRGILAGQGIQALVAEGNSVLVGSDAGLKFSQDGGVTWSNEGVTNVVALATGRGNFYAATETQVLQRTNLGWQLIGVWPVQQRPLSLAVDDNGEVYVGTGQGVYAFDRNTAQWGEWNPNAANAQAFAGLALSLTVGKTNANVNYLYVASFNGIWFTDATGWLFINNVNNKIIDLTTTIFTHDTEVFVGTSATGIWQGAIDANGLLNIAPIPQTDQLHVPNQADNAAILCLVGVAGSPFILYAGTTKGVFRGSRDNQNKWTWEHLGGLPDNAVVICLAVSGVRLFAGTELHGFLQFENNQWRPVTAVASLAGAAIAEINDANSPLFTTIAANNARQCIYPFHLTQSRQLRFLLNPALPLRLYQFEPNLHEILITVAGNSATSNDILQPGFYALVTSGQQAHTISVNTL